MSVFDWQGPSQLGIERKPVLSEMRPQNAYYWRKKAGLTGSRDKPVRGWRDDSCYFDQCGERDRKLIA